MDNPFCDLPPIYLILRYDYLFITVRWLRFIDWLAEPGPSWTRKFPLSAANQFISERLEVEYH